MVAATGRAWRSRPLRGWRPEGRNHQKQHWLVAGLRPVRVPVQLTARSGSGASAGLMATLPPARQRWPSPADRLEKKERAVSVQVGFEPDRTSQTRQ